jgi:hypothetical protein
MKLVIGIIRIILTLFLIYLIYEEAGPYTAAFSFLVFLHCETVSLGLRSLRRLVYKVSEALELLYDRR